MKPLTSQQKRMKELMGFTYEDNSHDLLSEENFKSIEVVENNLLSEQGGEPNWEWIKKEIQKGETITETKPGCFTVGTNDKRIRGVFEAKVTEGSNAVNDFVKILIEKIKTNPEAQKYLDKGGKFTIEEMDIIAGASNSISGSITPTMDNNYKPLNITKGSPEDLKYKHKIGSDRYNQNMGYAKGRGEGVRDGLIKAFGVIKGFDMKPDNIKITNHIIDTGGEIDKDRNNSSHPNPGQVVLVWMEVCWVNTETTIKEPIIEQFKRCMGELAIQVNYIDNGDHTCNHATFKIFANDIPLKRTGFGVDKETVDDNVGDFADLNNGGGVEGEIDNRPNGSKGGTRVNEFKIVGKELGELVTVDNLKKFKGGIQVQAECVDKSDVVKDTKWTDNRQVIYSINGKEVPPSFITKTNVIKYLYGGAATSGKLKLPEFKKYLMEKIYDVESLKELKKAMGYDGEWDIKKAMAMLKANQTLTSKPNPNISKRPNKKLRSGERIKTGFGCHKGVAKVKILQNGQEVDTQTAETPRYADGIIYTLGPEMEACNALWSKVVEDSKNQS